MKKLDNYRSALRVLEQAPLQDRTNEFVQSGIIGKFSLQFELGWKLLKALLAYEGDQVSASGSPREIIKRAFRYFDGMDEEAWLSMLRDRNDMTRIYDAVRASALVERIVDDYIPVFQRLEAFVLERHASGELDELA